MMRLPEGAMTALEAIAVTDNVERLFALAGTSRPVPDKERQAIQDMEILRGELMALDRELDRWAGLDWGTLPWGTMDDEAMQLARTQKAAFDKLQARRKSLTDRIEELSRPMRDALERAKRSRDEALSGLIQNWSPDLKRHLLDYGLERLALPPEEIDGDLRPGIWLALFRAAQAEGQRR